MDLFQQHLVSEVRRRARQRRLTLSHVSDRAGVSRSHFWDVMAGRKSPTLQWLGRVATALDCSISDLLGSPASPAGEPERRRIPLYSLRAAAGPPVLSQAVEPFGWLEVPLRRKSTEGLFAAQVVGKSMEPLIRDGALCLFRRLELEDAEGKVVLVQLRTLKDPETGGRYTVKRLRRTPSRSRRPPELVLESVNPAFPALRLPLQGEPDADVRVLAQFLEVVQP